MFGDDAKGSWNWADAKGDCGLEMRLATLQMPVWTSSLSSSSFCAPRVAGLPNVARRINVRSVGTLKARVSEIIPFLGPCEETWRSSL
jgi:hypothetical protein